jgi:hypothetical protein
MVLTYCSNCRLPVNVDVQVCPFCTARVVSRTRHLPMAAALALVATLAVVSRRRG